MLSIRMRRTGSKKRPYYRVVVAEGRDPREGAFKDILGTYNPRQKPAVVEVDRERLDQWIRQGARPSDSVRTLIARHLTRDRSAAAQAAPAAAEAGATAQTPAPTAPAVQAPPAPTPAAQETPAPALAAQENQEADNSASQTAGAASEGGAATPEGVTPPSEEAPTASPEQGENV